MIWRDLTSEKLGELDRRTVVLLPLASTEQHGPHLPLGTDTIISEHFCGDIERRSPEHVLILPVVAVGCSEHHMDFPGTVSVTHNAFEHYVTEILVSARRHGFGNFLLFNTHGGNQSVGQVIVEQFGSANPHCRVVLATWWDIAADELREITRSGPGGTGHAGEFETSLMLQIVPQLVDSGKIAPAPKKPAFEWADSDMLRPSKAYMYRSLRDISETGVDGSPPDASAETASKITDAVVNACLKIVEDLYNAQCR